MATSPSVEQCLDLPNATESIGIPPPDVADVESMPLEAPEFPDTQLAPVEPWATDLSEVATEATPAVSPVGVSPQPFHPVFTSLQLAIEGIEATQGTQFYKSSRHLPSGQAEGDNSVPLIQRKHLAIRVYPDARFRYLNWPFQGSVDGDVWFRRIDVPDTFKKAVRLNGPVTGRRAVVIDRGDANQTLNFRISDLYTVGRIVVYARVWARSRGKTYVSAWLGRIFQFTPVPHIRIRAYGIRYQRGNIDNPAPTLSDFIATGVYLRKTYPMSRFDFVSYGTITFGGDLTNTSGGGCGTGWNALWQQLRNLFIANGQDANVYGLMKPGIPTAYGGCGGGYVGVSFVGGGATMAQELGHGLDRSHAPGCGAGGPDPNYPQYNGYNSASIGEFGMDYATGQVYRPTNSNDFMGYCGRPWVSPYTYRALITGIQNQPTPAPAAGGAPLAAEFRGESVGHTERHLYLSFRIGCDGSVEILDGMTLHGPATPSSGRPTPYSVEVQDADGKALSVRRLTLTEAHQDLDHSHTEFIESLPMPDAAAKLVFRCGHGHDPTVVEIPKQAPHLHLGTLDLGGAPQSGRIDLTWKAEDPDGGNLRYAVRYSCDDGANWTVVALGLDSDEFSVDLDTLPGGERCRLQVLASSTLRSATVETEPFSVTRMPRRAMISPVEDATGERPARHLELAGCAHSPDGCADEDELQWFSSMQGYLGSGTHLIANNLIAGEHLITIVAPDGCGDRCRAEHLVFVPPYDA